MLRHLCRLRGLGGRLPDLTGGANDALQQCSTSQPSWQPLWSTVRQSTFQPYDDPDYVQAEILDTPANRQGNKRVSKAEKRARRGARRGPDRALRYESIPIPPDVSVLKSGSQLFFSGPLGSNGINLKAIDTDGLGALKVETNEDGKVTQIQVAGPSREFIGTAASLIRNKVHGVVRGYLMYLQLAGVGYRVSKETRPVTYEVDDERVSHTG